MADDEGDLAVTMLDTDIAVDTYVNDRDAIIAAAQRKRENQRAIDAARQDEELYAAQHGANAQKFGHDAFLESLPLRLARVLENAKQDKFDAELDALIVEIDRNKQAAEARGSAEHQVSGALATTQHLLALLDQEIEIERQTTASDDALSRLYAVRSRLNAKLNEV